MGKLQHILRGCVMVVCWTRIWKFDPRLREAKDKQWHSLFHIWASVRKKRHVRFDLNRSTKES